MKKRLCASLTVEAALVFPLFFSVVLFFLSFLQIIRTEQQLYYAAAELTEETAACGYLLKYADQETEALWDADGEYFQGAEFASNVLQGAGDAFWFRSMLEKKLPDVSCVNTVISGGLSGVSFWGSEVYAEDEMTVIRMNFKITFPVFQRILPKLSFKRTVIMRSFSGVGVFEQKNNGTEETAEEEGYVYITENGSVYHVDSNCTYIRLSVEQAVGETIAEKRNQYGGKYYPCETCMKDSSIPAAVWITKTGTRYHARRDCGKIKRTVKKIPRSEAEDYRLCSRCAKKME